MKILTDREVENYTITMDVIRWCLDDEKDLERLEGLASTVKTDQFLSSDVQLALTQAIGTIVRMIKEDN